MVIGESSRYDRWSLNGYERDTNPLLKQEANLVPLADVITAVSATRLSVPVIISRKPATQASRMASRKNPSSPPTRKRASRPTGCRTRSRSASSTHPSPSLPRKRTWCNS
ncbi:sulfatase-like hydrolase/transferase [Janthinobacterium agaricidamnosum]|uniref:sulfatase-like hydrolase/transferase n=1 Tax=Janthinobacterium agaricidamnosum TaxID=55508 RepID=UPI0032046806